MPGICGDRPLFSGEQTCDLRIGGSESELAVEPESAGLDALLVLEADLVRIDRERCDAEDLPEQVQELREDPRRLPFAKRVVHVETDLDPIEEGEPLEVADGHAVLQDERGVSGAQRQAATPFEADQKDLDATPHFRGPDGRGVAVREVVVLAIAKRRRLPRELEKRGALSARQPADGERR